MSADITKLLGALPSGVLTGFAQNIISNPNNASEFFSTLADKVSEIPPEVIQEGAMSIITQLPDNSPVHAAIGAVTGGGSATDYIRDLVQSAKDTSPATKALATALLSSVTAALIYYFKRHRGEFKRSSSNPESKVENKGGPAKKDETGETDETWEDEPWKNKADGDGEPGAPDKAARGFATAAAMTEEAKADWKQYSEKHSGNDQQQRVLLSTIASLAQIEGSSDPDTFSEADKTKLGSTFGLDDVALNVIAHKFKQSGKETETLFDFINRNSPESNAARKILLLGVKPEDAGSVASGGSPYLSDYDYFEGGRGKYSDSPFTEGGSSGGPDSAWGGSPSGMYGGNIFDGQFGLMLSRIIYAILVVLIAILIAYIFLGAALWTWAGFAMLTSSEGFDSAASNSGSKKKTDSPSVLW